MTRGAGGSLTFSPEVSNGIGAFAASSQGDDLMSRGANSVFQKLKLGIRGRQGLPLGIQQNFKFGLQYATSKLTPQEQFSMGGLESVRGYPPDDFYADNAVSWGLEYLIPSYWVPKKLRLPYASKSLREMITSVVFSDYAYGIRYGEDNKSHSYFGLGTGLRFDIFNQGVLRLEWGVPLGDRPITESKATRFHISVDIQESLPEEIARILRMRAEKKVGYQAMKLIDDELLREDSELSRKFISDLNNARALEQGGDIEGARKLYEKIRSDSKAVYQQAETYVKDVAADERELEAQSELAQMAYDEGRVEEAKKLWAEVAEKARLKSLTFEL